MRSPCGPYPRCLHPVFSLKMASSRNTRSSAAYLFISSIYASLSASLRARKRRAIFFCVHLFRFRSQHIVGRETITPRSTASQKAISSCIIQPSEVAKNPISRGKRRAVSEQITLPAAYRTYRYKNLSTNRLRSPSEYEEPYTLGHFIEWMGLQ